MLKFTVVKTCLLFSILSLLGVVFLITNLFATSNPKSVYINNVTLFNGFNMSKDLGKKHQSEIKKVEKSFDSLVTVFNIFKEQKNEKKILELQNKLQIKDKQLAQMNDYLRDQVSQQVWNRLNVYIKEYGLKNDFTYIFGTQGGGNVMYAKEALDVTEELLEYVNAKYEGE